MRGEPLRVVMFGRGRWPRAASPRARHVVGGSELGQSLPFNVKLQSGPWPVGGGVEGDRLWSGDRSTHLYLPTDGNLAIDRNGDQQWRASDQGFTPRPGFAGYAMLSPDGELAVYASDGTQVWSNGYHDDPSQLDPAGMVLQNDGNFVLYDSRGLQGGGSRWATQPGLSHSVLPGWAQSALGAVQDFGNTFKFPGWNMTVALLTGGDPVAAFKRDAGNMADSAQVAAAVASGNVPAAVALIAKGSPVPLPPVVLQGVTAALSSGGNVDPGAMLQTAVQSAQDPAQLATLLGSHDYLSAWVQATAAGSVKLPGVPAPTGRAYAAPPASVVMPSVPTYAPAPGAPTAPLRPWGPSAPGVSYSAGGPLIVRF